MMRGIVKTFPQFWSRLVLNDYRNIASADRGDIGSVVAPGLDHADRVAFTVLGGDGGVPGAELSDADDVVAATLIGVGKVAETILTDHRFVADTRLRVD